MANHRKLVFLTYFVCLAVTQIGAQTNNSAIIINLTDQVGNIVVAARVNLNIDTPQKKAAKTNDNGTAEFRGLAPGRYQISISVDGFKEYQGELVTVKAGEIKRMDIVLELAVIETKVEVGQNDGLDMSSSGAPRDLGKEQIETLPDDPDELKRILQNLAGPTITGEEMPISVNGIPGATLPSKENIKLVRINRNVFSAQYEGTFGGGIEIFTNSDAKKITGWIGYRFADARFNATDPYIGREVPYQTRSLDYGFTAPIGKKMKVSYYGAHNSNETSSIVDAVILDQNLQIIDFIQAYDAPSSGDSHYLTLDVDPNKKHKVYVTYSFNKYKSPLSGVGGFSLLSRASIARNFDHSFGFSDTYIINPDFVNTTRLSGRISTSENAGNIRDAAINVTESFQGGGSQSFSSRDNKRVEFYNDTTRKVGRFNVGFGVMLRWQKLNEISRSNFGGTYTFTGKVAPVLDGNYNPILGPGGNIVTAQISSIESYQRTLRLTQLGLSPTTIRSLGGGADQFTIAGGEPEIGVGQFDYAIYQQNSFGISDTLGLSFGVRYENQTNIENRTNFAPRFGFIWSPKAKDKQKPITTLPRISAGVGMFYSRFGINYTMSERQANNPDRSYYFITDPAILNLFPAVPTIADLQQAATPRSLRLIDDEIQTPLQGIFNVNVTKRLWYEFGLNLSYSYSRGFRQIVSRNINAPLVGPGGSLVYPFGNARNISEERSEGESEVGRYSVGLNFPQWKLLGNALYASFFYNYAKISNDVVRGSSSVSNPYDFSHEWGPTGGSGVHYLQGFFSISFPHMISLRGDFYSRTGSRFNITTGRDTNRDGQYAERPSFAANPAKPGVIQTPYGALDPNPAAGDMLIPRNYGRGPGATEFNFYLSKTIGFNKDKANKNALRQRLNFSVSISNAFNVNNKGNPLGNMSSPNFLQTVSNSGDGEFRQSSPRRFSFGTSFSF